MEFLCYHSLQCPLYGCQSGQLTQKDKLCLVEVGGKKRLEKQFSMSLSLPSLAFFLKILVHKQ